MHGRIFIGRAACAEALFGYTVPYPMPYVQHTHADTVEPCAVHAESRSETFKNYVKRVGRYFFRAGAESALPASSPLISDRLPALCALGEEEVGADPLHVCTCVRLDVHASPTA